MGYFLISEDVVDRNDLTIEEKMACVVLARYADIKDLQALLSLDIIAVKMGCTIIGAQKAVEGLVEKGILLPPQVTHETVIPKERGDLMPSYIYRTLDDEQLMITLNEKKPSIEKAKKVELKEAKPTQNLKVNQPISENMINKLKDYFEEIVSESNIRLMLNLADGDEQRIMQAYERCKQYPYNQRIEKLVDHLQGIVHHVLDNKSTETPPIQPMRGLPQGVVTKPVVEEKLSPKEDINTEDLSDDYDALLSELSSNPDIKHLNQQINVKRIKQLYTAYGKK